MAEVGALSLEGSTAAPQRGALRPKEGREGGGHAGLGALGPGAPQGAGLAHPSLLVSVSLMDSSCFIYSKLETMFLNAE